MKPIIPYKEENLLKLGARCGAVYVCPKDSSGRRKGPLVAYAGKDSSGRNLVGELYFNFRRIEPHLEVVGAFAETAYIKILKADLTGFDTVCGIPNGGRTLGQELARISGRRFVYAEKEPKQTEAGKKQEYTWNLSQFEFEPGERLAVVEDVFNNFQNTNNTLAEIEKTGAQVVMLVGALNRSPVYDTAYKGLPVIASIREAYPEYRQDDPAVADDINAGLLEKDVKKNWSRLMAAMGQ